MVVPPFHTPTWSFVVGKPMVVGYQHFSKLPYMYVYLLLHYLPHRIHETGIFTYMHHEHQPNIGQYTIYTDPIGTVDGEGNSMEHNFLDVKHIFNKSCDQTTVQVPVLLTGAWLLPAVVVGKYVPPCDYFLRLKNETEKSLEKQGVQSNPKSINWATKKKKHTFSWFIRDPYKQVY